MRHENSRFKEEVNGSESIWICVLAQERSLCVNVSRTFIQHGQNGLHAQLAHSFPWLLSAGILTSIFFAILISRCRGCAFFFFLPTLTIVYCECQEECHSYTLFFPFCIFLCCILCNFVGAGLPFTTSAMVDVKQSEGGLSAELALHAGAQELKFTLQRRLHNSTEIPGRLLVCGPLSTISPQFQWCFLIIWFVFPSVRLIRGGTDCLYLTLVIC